MKKQKIVSLIIAGGIGLLVLFVWLSGFIGLFGFFQAWDNKLHDYLFTVRGPVKPADNIVIAVIDEASIAALGRWPWPRNVHAKLVNRLTKAGAKAIVFDVLFTEPDLDRPWADREFGKTIRASGRVAVNYYYEPVDGGEAKLTLPIPSLSGCAAIGFANSEPDLDGANRRISLITEHDGTTYPSLALAGLSVFLDKSPLDILYERRVPMGENSEMLINFSGPNGMFPYLSYHKILDGEIPDDRIRGKIVLVGSTAVSLFDNKVTPFSHILPGVEIHATVMSNILLGNSLRRWNPGITMLFILFFVMLSGLILARISPLKGGLTAAGVFFGYFGFIYYLLAVRNVYGEFVAPAFALSLSYGGILFYRFMTEEKEKRWIKKMFGQYVSPKVLEKIMADPGSLKLGGQKQVLTVLFSDIRGFTTITESLPAEELVNQLNEYLSKMVEVVFRHDGYLDKFIGDAVMAFWGAPAPQNDQAKRAVLCAIEMIEELGKLNTKWRSEGKKGFTIGIGINTGEMTVGNTGSKEKMEYTVLGDNVNLGSRLEGLNKEYKTSIIVSDTTFHQVSDLVEAESLGTVKVKGKEKSVEIHAVIGRKGAPRTVGTVEQKAEVPEKKKTAGKKPFDPDARIEIKK